MTLNVKTDKCSKWNSNAHFHTILQRILYTHSFIYILKSRIFPQYFRDGWMLLVNPYAPLASCTAHSFK